MDPFDGGESWRNTDSEAHGITRQGENTNVVAEDIDDRQAHNGPPGGLGAGVLGVDHGGDQLREAAEEHADDEEHAAAADVGDDCAIDQDGDDPDGREDAGVLEAVADVCHLEEVRSVC